MKRLKRLKSHFCVRWVLGETYFIFLFDTTPPPIKILNTYKILAIEIVTNFYYKYNFLVEVVCCCMFSLHVYLLQNKIVRKSLFACFYMHVKQQTINCSVFSQQICSQFGIVYPLRGWFFQPLSLLNQFVCRNKTNIKAKDMNGPASLLAHCSPTLH